MSMDMVIYVYKSRKWDVYNPFYSFCLYSMSSNFCIVSPCGAPNNVDHNAVPHGSRKTCPCNQGCKYLAQ